MFALSHHDIMMNGILKLLRKNSEINVKTQKSDCFS